MANSKKKPIVQKKVEVIQKEYKRPILRILFKSLIGAAFVFGVLYYYDSLNRFRPDQKNNHTIKKWDAFYDFTETKNVDILLVGNSHLYTGINPKNLSTILGSNSFILASPGTHIGDSYFSLKEAITKCKPKVVVIETYGISDFDPYDLAPATLSDQFKSFDARRNLGTKLSSTPYLFQIDDYPKAWSTTIRNHNFLFTNYEQVEKNIELEERKKRKSQKLYLGRYVRFQTGVEDSIEKLYETKGAPVNGKDYEFSKYSYQYVTKIKQLCKENGIKLIFLTLPMYERHIKDYSSWEKQVSKLIDPDKNSWLNLQKKANYEKMGFDATCFENTYSSNQHMTYNGSLLATYHLAEYIKNLSGLKLRSQKSNADWLKTFRGEEGYYENCSATGAEENRIIVKDHTASFGLIKEVVSYPDGKNTSFVLKLEKKGANFEPKKGSKIALIAVTHFQGKDQRLKLEIPYNFYRATGDYYYFTQIFKAIQFKKILDYRVIP